MGDISLLIRHCKRSNDVKLDLSGKGLNTVHQDVFSLNKLEFLDLSDNKISVLDQKICQLQNLKYLDLSKNNLLTLPQSLATLTKLKMINLDNNPLNKQFESLLIKENQSEPLLSKILNACFKNEKYEETKNDTDDNNWLNKSQKLNTNTSWLDNTTKSEDKLNIGQSLNHSNSNSNSGFANFQKQIQDLELQLSLEKRKVEDLQNKLEESKHGAGLELNDSAMDIDIKELKTGDIISQGGFSIVYKGFFRGTQVAIKKIFDPVITPELLSEVNNEIKMLTILRHPNIVLLMGVCNKPPNLVIVTEYLLNATLFNLLHKTQNEVKPQQKLQIAKEIALAILYLHKSSVVHRDIKSHNILLDEQLRVKLCDFGLARHTSDLNKGTSQFSGTPAYMAPELFKKKAYDMTVDIFAFGTLLWELFSREVPFEGLDPNDVMQKVLKDQKLSNANVPPKIMSLVDECRSINTTNRPDMDKIVSVLNSIRV